MRETPVGTAGVAAGYDAAADIAPLQEACSITTTESTIGVEEPEFTPLHPGNGRGNERRSGTSNGGHGGRSRLYTSDTFNVVGTGRQLLIGERA